MSSERTDAMLNRKEKFWEVYRIGQLIGRGTYGEVRVCKHIYSMQLRAVRILQKSLMDENDVNKFMTEMLVLISCDHKNIVHFYELYQDDNNFYIVCELCKGGELFQYMQAITDANDSFNERDASTIIVQVLSALSYLHKN